MGHIVHYLLYLYHTDCKYYFLNKKQKKKKKSIKKPNETRAVLIKQRKSF